MNGLICAGMSMVFVAATCGGAASDQGTKLSPLPLSIFDVTVTPHQFSDEMHYRTPPDPELGALVRVFVAHTDPDGEPVQPRITVNERTPTEWLDADAWAWYEMPENLGDEDEPFVIEPGAVAMFTFNGKTDAWGVGNTVQFAIEDVLTEAQASVSLPIAVDPLRIRQITCLAAEPDSIIPEHLVFHVTNDGAEQVTLRDVAVYPESRRAARRTASFTSPAADNAIPAGGRMVFEAETGPLPLTHGYVELVFDDANGVSHTRWAHLRFKADQFDIGAGWLMIPSKDDIVPLTQESYLKTLKRMHVNLFWGEHVPGYTDDDGPDGLYTRYPMRQMAFFEDFERYNADEWVARIHGVDRLGEPQHVRQSPMSVYEALAPYKEARYPTMVTLSEERTWRYYIGIVDFPHYDAYRVSAPAADVWAMYDCWDQPIRWGAPLETIGVMTRSLREQSEPLPIGIWSQNVHEGWQSMRSRHRRSPTPDEILMQAYQGLANGVVSLYWYSMQSWSLLKFRDAIDISTRIGREIRLLDDLYLAGYPSHVERVMGDVRPELEFNVISAPDAALLFAMDLDYYPDHDERVFAFRGPRDIEREFPLPAWLQDPADVFRVDAEGVYDVAWEPTAEGVRITDRLDRVGIYIAAKRPEERTERAAKLAELKAYEEAVGFDPGHNDADYQVLLNDLGFEDASELDRFQ